jgi:hypothetical protein
MPVDDDDFPTAPPNVRRLREHIMGCPAALRAFQPALPVFRDDDQLMQQFVVSSASRS